MVSLLPSSTLLEVFVRLVQYFLLAIALSVFPYIAFRLTAYLLAPVTSFPDAAAQPVGGESEDQMPILPKLSSFELEKVVGAVAAASSCLVIFGALRIVEFSDRDNTFFFQSPLPELSIDKTDFYIRTSGVLIVTCFLCLFYMFVIALRTAIRSDSLRMAALAYVLVYMAFNVITLDKYTTLKVLSFYFTNFLSPFSRETVTISKNVGYWPEQLFQYLFYFIITFCALRYLGTYFVCRIKRDREGDFDVKAIWVAVNAFTWIFSVFIGFMFMQINFVSLGIFTGVLGAGVSIAFRDLLNNFFSGILLNLDNSIKIGDVIRTSDNIVGEVSTISLRYTCLATRDNVDVLIPNSVLVQNRFESLTRTKQEVRLSLRFSVGQDADVAKVREVATQACLVVPEVSAAMGRPPTLFFIGASESANLFDLRFWVVDPRPGPAKLQSDVAYAIFRAFKEAKIPLPSFRLFTPPVEPKPLAISPLPVEKLS